nr:translation initiation factor 2 [Deltaproteobacteria bacterium]
MKTLTEFSTLTLRKAAEARAAAGGAAKPVAPAGPAPAAAPES